MQIQKGQVKYKDRNDIICTYGITDDGKQYYFLDGYNLSNGNIIATTSLVEAIDPGVVSVTIGLIDPDGKVIIPFENKTIKPITNDILLVEKATPTTKSVLDAIALRSDPTAAAKLVTTPATIKDNVNARMGSEGRFVFNDQFSEASLYDLNGNNIIDNELYSFIGMTNDRIYLSRNTVESEVKELPVGTQAVDNNVMEDKINVEDAVVSKDVIENAINTQMEENEKTLVKTENETPAVEAENTNTNDTQSLVPSAADMQAVVPPVEDVTTGTIPETVTENAESVTTEADNAENVVEETPTEVAENTDNTVVEETKTVDAVAEEPTTEETVVEEATKDAVEEEKNEEAVVEEKVEEPKTEDNLEADKVEDESTMDLHDISSDVVVPFVSGNDEKEESNDDLPLDIASSILNFNNETKSEQENTLSSVSDIVDINATNEAEVNIDSDEDKDDFNVSYDDENKDVYDMNTDNNLFDVGVDDINDSDMAFDTTVSEDSVDADDYMRDYNITNPTKDSIIEETAVTMSNLIRLNRTQQRQLSNSQEHIIQLNAAGKRLSQKTKSQAKEIEALKNKVKNYELIVSKLESKNSILDNRVHDQERVIDTQKAELDTLRPQVEGKQELAKLLQDAKSLLGSEESYDTESYGKRRAA